MIMQDGKNEDQKSTAPTIMAYLQSMNLESQKRKIKSIENYVNQLTFLLCSKASSLHEIRYLILL